MKKKIIFLLLALSVLAFQVSPYARRIRPFASTPSSCQENEIGYNMTSHSLLICTGSTYSILATGGSGGTAAPTNATYITQTANGTLTNEQALSALATGIIKNTTTTGVLSIAVGGTDFENPLTFNSPLSRSTNTISCSTCALTSGNLSQFASTTSAQLAGVLSDESGSGVSLFANLSSLTANDVLTWNGTNWINQAVASGGGTLGSGNVNMTVANASSTGTTANRLTKLTGAPSTAVITATTDTENAVGICTSGCGTTGSATIAILGQVNCDFDNATTAGNYVTISAITAGKCHDAGSSFPTTSAAYGRVLTTNGASGTFAIELMTPDIAFQNAGNGKSKPGGSNLDYQYNGTGNVFSGGRLKQENTNIVSVNGGLNTAQTFKVYKTDNGSGQSQWMQMADNGSNAFEILSSAAGGASVQNMILRVAGGGNGALLGTGAFQPFSDRGLDLGGSSNRWNQAFLFTVIINGGDITYTSGPQLANGGGGWLQLKDPANSALLTRLSMGDPGATGVSLTKPASSTYFEMRNGDNSGYVQVVTLRYCFSGTTVCDHAGSGSPEGTVTASVGSTYHRTDGGAVTSFYVKESGSGNTGWVAK